MTAEKTMSLAAFARKRGVSRVTARKWRDRGYVLINNKGRVRVAASDALLRVATDLATAVNLGTAIMSNGNGNGTGNDHGDEHRMDLAEAVAMKERFLAQTRRLEYERAAGRVCAIEAIEARVASDYAVIRNRLMGLGSKVTPLLGSPNAEETKSIIDRVVIEALSELSSPAVREELRAAYEALEAADDGGDG